MSKRKKWTQEQIDQWNKDYPIGTRVERTDDDGNKHITATRSEAWLLGSGQPVVKVDGITGGYSLDRIKPTKIAVLTRISLDTDFSKPGFHLLPCKPGVCQECAVDHFPYLPHNNQSMFYQYHFYAEHNRFPTWEDAMSHCTEAMKELWRKELTAKGVKLA